VSRGPRTGSDRLAVRVARFALPPETGRGPAAAGRSGFLLGLHAADGRSGWGEASPLPGHAEESPAGAAAALLSAAASPPFRSRLEEVAGDPLAAVGTWGVTGRLSGPASELLAAPLPASARAALVSALLDLAGRASGAPVRALLGARAVRPAGLAPVSLNALVPLEEPEPAAEAARAAVRRGIATLKAKLGPASRFERDLAALRAIRDAVGDGVAIRLDVNGLWSVAEARRLLPVLAGELAPEYVEDPVPPDDLAELAGAPVPLAADAALRAPERAERLLASGTVAVLVLKPALLGGLDRCLDLARHGAARGLASVVTHAFEGPVGHAAACELALALRNGAAPPGPGAVPPACGLDAHPALAAWPQVRVPQLRPASVAPVDVSGLGVDPSVLLERPAAGPPGDA
jgi:L-Ala-D/L-Glu epimerase